MRIDALGFERQFVDHCAPVWNALPSEVRGTYYADAGLTDHARSLGIEAEPVDVASIKRREPLPPKARPGDGPVAFAASIGDIKLGRRLGYRRFVFIEHGCGQAYLGDGGIAHPSYSGGADREDVGLFLVPNDYSGSLWRAAYPAAQVEVVGSPRLDGLPSRIPGPGPVVAFSFHWPAFVSPEAGTAVGHYSPSLPGVAKRFTTIGHAHPKGDWPARMQRHYQRAGIPFVADFADVCRQADVYVCDNSSTLYEFASTGRPVVVLNSPMYRRRVKHGGRFWDWADVGPQVDHPRDLIPAIERALEHRPADVAAREDVLESVYAYRYGAAERAAAVIATWAAEREAVAA